MWLIIESTCLDKQVASFGYKLRKERIKRYTKRCIGRTVLERILVTNNKREGSD
jgi:hypothetical protein